MAVIIPHKAIDAISAAANPRLAIMGLVKDHIDKFRIPGDRVLVGIYVRPEKTRGGIIRPDMNKEEDIWQGKVGLVLKLGTNAFKDTDDYSFPEEDKAKPGEWCAFKIGDTWTVKIGDCPCRMVRDIDIQMLGLEDPTIVF
jgi:co-chaperonin GroES (HSP10)